MTDPSSTAAITAMLDATNRGDADAFVESFTDDAVITDFGRVFHEHDGVRSWDSTDNIGVGMHFDLVSLNETGPDAWDVEVDASSRRFSGRSTLKVTLRDGRIATLETS